MTPLKKLSMAVLVCCAFSTAPVFAQQAETSNQPAAIQATDLEQVLNAQLIEQFSPGLAVAVVADGKIIFSKGYGKLALGAVGTASAASAANAANAVTADTPFYIASTTKAFSAHIAAQLAEKGVFSLKTPVTKLMPGLRFHPDIKADEITLERLLNHTHGIDGDGPIGIITSYTGSPSGSEALQALLAQHPPAKTGNQFDYSNIGPIVAAWIIEHKTGKPWQDLVDELIFKPLKMQHSANRLSQVKHLALAQGHEISPDGFHPAKIKKQDANMHAAGGTFSSANDLAAWLGVHLQQGQWQGKTLYSPQLMAQAWTETAKQDRMAAGMKRVGWSLGWDIAQYKGQKIVLRPGGFTGYGAHISMMPERGMGVVVLSNGGQISSMLSEHIVNSLYALLLKEPNYQATRIAGEARLSAMHGRALLSLQADLKKRADRQKPLPLPLEDYTGTFQSSFGTLKSSIKDNRLHLQMGLVADDAEVFDADKHAFRTELFGGGQTFTYVFAEGKVKEINLGGTIFRKM